MKSTVERLSPTRVRINVEVPFDELKPDFDRAYKKIAQQVRVPGFRPGKVPARIIEARLGRGVVLERGRQRRHPAPSTPRPSASAEEVSPLGRPDIEVTEIADGEQARVHRRGRRPPGDHAAGARRRSRSRSTTSRSTDADVTRSWTTCAPASAPSPASSGPPPTTTSCRSTCPPPSTASPSRRPPPAGFSYQVGQGGLIDGIDEAITGLSAGESATFPTTLVAGEYADQDAEVTVTVTAVKERQLPDADDEFAQLASEFDTLDELTDDLRTRLGRVKRMEQVTQARDKVLDALVDATEVPLPESIVQAEIESRVHDAVHPFDHDEDKFAEFLDAQGKTREEFDAETRAEAEKSVRTRLVLDALADAQEVSVSEQELTERIVFQAQQYRMPPEEFVRRIQEAGQLGRHLRRRAAQQGADRRRARGHGHRRVGRRDGHVGAPRLGRGRRRGRPRRRGRGWRRRRPRTAADDDATTRTRHGRGHGRGRAGHAGRHVGLGVLMAAEHTPRANNRASARSADRIPRRVGGVTGANRASRQDNEQKAG